jgi:hypothetical protein
MVSQIRIKLKGEIGFWVRHLGNVCYTPLFFFNNSTLFFDVQLNFAHLIWLIPFSETTEHVPL